MASSGFLLIAFTPGLVSPIQLSPAFAGRSPGWRSIPACQVASHGVSRIREEKESSVYVQFTGLTLDDQGTALDGFACVSNHDLRFSGNVIVNTGGAGIATVGCNYVVADRNILNHTGYLPSGAPQDFSGPCGISFHNNACSDAYAGFHFVAASNNIVATLVAPGNGISGRSNIRLAPDSNRYQRRLSCAICPRICGVRRA